MKFLLVVVEFLVSGGFPLVWQGDPRPLGGSWLTCPLYGVVLMAPSSALSLFL